MPSWEEIERAKEQERALEPKLRPADPESRRSWNPSGPASMHPRDGRRYMLIVALAFLVSIIAVYGVLIVFYLTAGTFRLGSLIGLALTIGFSLLVLNQKAVKSNRGLLILYGAAGVSLALIWAAWFVLVVDNLTPLPEPTPTKTSNMQPTQEAVQISYANDRAALKDGSISIVDQLSVQSGKSLVITARVCGSESKLCINTAQAPAESVPTPSSVPSRRPIKVGARIAAWATSSPAAGIDPKESIVQPVLTESDSAEWEWSITPQTDDALIVTVHFRVLRGEGNEALEPDTTAKVKVTVTKGFGKTVLETGQKAAVGARDLIAWLAGILGALGVTGVVLLRLIRRRRAGGADPPKQSNQSHRAASTAAGRKQSPKRARSDDDEDEVCPERS